MSTKRILIMAGGTGGHVFPALVVAKRLEAEDWEVLWLGTRPGLETDIVTRESIRIQYISVTGFRGKKILSLVMAPFRMLQGLYQSLKVLRAFKPDVVLGMGGFVSGPGGLAAWILNIPLVIHEQNAIPGTTNKLLSKLAKRVLQAFPNTFVNAAGNPSKFLLTGNPIRRSLMLLPPPESRFKLRQGPLHLLLIGGSRGAQALNELCPKAVALIPSDLRPEIKHQVGAGHVEKTQLAYQSEGLRAEVLPFIQDMAAAYAWADLVICRAGALTISELGAVGIGSILVPYPFAIDDHQWVNAQFLEKEGAAIVIRQHDLTPSCLAEQLLSFSQDRTKGLHLAEAAKKAFKLDATTLVVHACKEVAYGG
jgi:UDP-N-acetylglucosamine--N-acetylmuramyl-(pentapeptide) pyrophosphoryl-undecaprenol N-acetylglucosamine transferase